ncbi:MAG TPA: DUF1631 family protein, partial [Candidatus Angelobacter sp.]|nr:DUF1631 family protein [Candidatus Angelobacter sp.]
MSEFTLQAITEGDSLQLSEVFASIAAAEASDPAELRQQLSAELLSHYVHANPWDARLQSLLDKVIPVALVQITNDDEFYCATEHPLRAFFNSITQPASRWCPRDSRPNQQLYDKLSELVAFILYYWSNNTPDQTTPAANMQQHLDEFNSWLATEDKRAAMLEARLCETELANLKLTSAETRVTDVINHNLAQRPLATELHGAITGTLRSELQYWAFNTDPAELPQLPLWKSW